MAFHLGQEIKLVWKQRKQNAAFWVFSVSMLDLLTKTVRHTFSRGLQQQLHNNSWANKTELSFYNYTAAVAASSTTTITI